MATIRRINQKETAIVKNGKYGLELHFRGIVYAAMPEETIDEFINRVTSMIIADFHIECTLTVITL